MIKAVIFDMDGLLIDSEGFWADVKKEVFTPFGVPAGLLELPLTRGMRTDEIVEYWYNRYPWTTPTKKDVEAQIVDGIVHCIKEKGTAMPGAIEAVKKVKEMGLPRAIASSSFMDIIDAVMDKLQLHDLIDIVHSAEHEAYGKPHPGVFISTADKLGVRPDEILVFEDALNGVIAAKAAKMKVIAVPNHDVADDKRFILADRILSSLEDLKDDHFVL